MDVQIIAAIITAAATIFAVFISHWLVVSRKVAPPDPIEEPTGAPKETTAESIDRDFIVGVALSLALAVIFGLSHVLGKYIVTTSTENPLLVITGRNVISGLFILIFAHVIRHLKQEQVIKYTYTKDSAFMVLGRSASSIFYFLTFLYLTATATITLYKLNTIFTFILLMFLVTQALSRISVANILIGIVVGIAGSVVTIGGFGESLNGENQTSSVGVSFALLAGIFWSVYIVFSERYSANNPQYNSLSSRQSYVGRIYLFSSIPLILLLAVAPFTMPEQYSTMNISLEGLFGVVALGCISGVIGILYFEALKRISSLLVGVIISLEIFFTMVFENIFLGQNITWNLFVGALLVIVASISVGRESKKLKLRKSSA